MYLQIMNDKIGKKEQKELIKGGVLNIVDLESGHTQSIDSSSQLE